MRDLQGQGAPVAVVYPSGVLGPDAPDLGSTYLGLVGWVRTPPKTSSGCSIVDVRDVALAIERALDAPPARWMLGGTFMTVRRVARCRSRASPAFTGGRCPLPERRSASPAGPVIS